MSKTELLALQAQRQIERLLAFALHKQMIQPLDATFARNALLDLFRFTEPFEGELTAELPESPIEMLEALLDYGAAIGLIPDNTTTWRDLLDARIMGLLMPRPSEVAAAFAAAVKELGVPSATDRFYQLNIDSNYIRMDRIRNNQYWLQPTEYGSLEITINLSKPEKDPREIALLKTLPPSRYPKCLLCESNVGYAGRPDHPARQNLRILPLTLQDEAWYFQYSPYVYYNEHSIVFRGEHLPMQISAATFARLLDFVEQFPHYFIGSNADLPIVGGSILHHDHFQAGRHTFPMETAPVEATFRHPELPGLTYGTVKWPMSVVRLQGQDKREVLAGAAHLLAAWRAYNDPAAEIMAWTQSAAEQDRIPHNTITPIARLRKDGRFELDLVLRNNRTSEAHPDGIFHPHSDLHHIKKENIGLIEVMGLAVLPGRLKLELDLIAAYLCGQQTDLSVLHEEGQPLRQHASWIEQLLSAHGTSRTIEEAAELVQDAAGDKFKRVLLDAGVFKRDAAGQEAFRQFLVQAGLRA